MTFTEIVNTFCLAIFLAVTWQIIGFFTGYYKIETHQSEKLDETK